MKHLNLNTVQETVYETVLCFSYISPFSVTLIAHRYHWFIRDLFCNRLLGIQYNHYVSVVLHIHVPVFHYKQTFHNYNGKTDAMICRLLVYFILYSGENIASHVQ